MRQFQTTRTSWHRRPALRAFGHAVIVVLMLATMSPVAEAEQPSQLSEKPFAEHRIVLQLSDNDPKKQSLVISVAYNLLKLYDPDKVAIEVVAFGPGIDLLFRDNANRKLVESLVAQGVRVDICLNTVDTIERESGKRPEFIAAATPVQVGVGQILSLIENGYTLVRP
jgi:intracellular sulfur oxidation DsrE/DsrF family protein